MFYLESASPELKESSIIMKIGFKFAKIEYFQNLQESRNRRNVAVVADTAAADGAQVRHLAAL